MASSSRWNRTSAASSSDQAQSRSRGQEYQGYQNETPDGYALRRSEEIPDNQFRTPSTLPSEDHLAFSNGYRRRTEWFQAHERVRKKRTMNLHTLMGQHTCSTMTGMKCLWMLFPGSSIGAQVMESLMILSNGLLSF